MCADGHVATGNAQSPAGFHAARQPQRRATRWSLRPRSPRGPDAGSTPSRTHHLVQDARLDRDRASFAALVAHLLKETENPFWDCEDLQTIVQTVRGDVDEEIVGAITEEALRLGCSDAPDW